MKKISNDEQKKIMLEILKYFDEICRENGIKYSLIGGSLIGAVRHKGMIPWDDDIDVILDKNNYEKVINILLNNNNSQYKLLYHYNDSNYYFPFPKLVCTKTYCVEQKLLNPISNYGIYIDIFCYHNTANNKREQIKHLRKIKLINSMLSRKKLNFKNESIMQNIKRLFKNILSMIIGYNMLNKLIVNILSKYDNDVSCNYVVSSWPIYSIEKEIQKKSSILEYTDSKFDGINSMIYKSYDEILKTTFGDYMKLPPVEKRVNHGLVVYWRDDDEK